MTEQELIAFLDDEHRQSSRYQWGDLDRERERNLKYYLREPLGNEVEGRSQVVSSHVADTIEWMLPALIRIFVSTDKAVEFEPSEQNDVGAAKQATDACNYVFYRQNSGFLTLYTWLKDGLMSKTGAAKWWWDDKKSTRVEKYRGLTDEQVMMLTMNDEAEVVAHTPTPGADGVTLHDIDIRIKKHEAKACIAPLPPEEVLVSRRHNSVLLDDCPYVAHVSEKTLSELREMGIDVKPEDLSADANIDVEHSVERLLRRNRQSSEDHAKTESTDPALRTGWVHEEYVLVDWDGDGIAERRRILRSGRNIFENEECDHVQIAVWTPIIMPHALVGICPADESRDLQLLGSTIWRQMLDNLYVANNGRHAVLASSDGRVQANLDDLLTSRPNGIVREYVPNAVRPLPTPWVASQAFPMLEYIDQQRMNRTGSNTLSSGLDADSINKTARGATLAANQMQQRVELIARVFAETGLKPLFRGVVRLLTRYATRPMLMRLRNEFVSYDPRGWKNEYDMTINVGLGTGDKDQQLIHLQSMAQAQQAAVQGGGLGQIITLKNIYNVQAKIAENAGFKDVTSFWTDPDTAKPQQPQPSPEQIEAENEMNLAQAKIESEERLAQEKMRMEFELEKYKADLRAQTDIQIASLRQPMAVM